LGDSIEAIAAEKAGILRPGVPVVSGVTQPGPRDVIRREAVRLGCPLIEAGVDFEAIESAVAVEEAVDGSLFDYRRRGKFELPGLRLAMPGRHQAANAAMAVAVIDELRKAGWNVPESAVRSGLARAICPGRIEILDSKPIIVLDVAHNRASIEALVEVIGDRFSDRRKWAIFAAAADKDLGGMIEALLPGFDEVVFTRFLDNPRAAAPEELARLGKNLTCRVYPVYSTPAESWAAIAAQARADDMVCVTGSFYLVTEMRRILSSSP